MSRVKFTAEIDTVLPSMQPLEQVAESLESIRTLLLRGIQEGYIRDARGVAVGTFKLRYSQEGH